MILHYLVSKVLSFYLFSKLECDNEQISVSLNSMGLQWDSNALPLYQIQKYS